VAGVRRVSQTEIVVDSSHPLARENRCFDPAVEYTGCGHALNVRLAQKAARRGFACVTADVLLQNGRPQGHGALVTDMVTENTDRLLAAGAAPAICLSLESPLNAPRFFHEIRWLSGRFCHSYQFRGTKERLASTRTTFHSVVFPIETREPLALQPWATRRRLVLVNSNRRAGVQAEAGIRGTARAVAQGLRHRLWRMRDPWLRSPELYRDRVEAIRHFSDDPGFALFGHGWDHPIPGFSAAFHRAARKVYAGEIPPGIVTKRRVIAGFKFAICFENCAFPGYITEKLFDCFLAGCVPVYLGAPDVTDFVPASAFIDYRGIGSFAELDRHLRDMPEAEALRYVSAARDFLRSERCDRFTVDTLVDSMLDNIAELAAR
jgi:alpha(1,3/1,4) fucosyltransferase